MSEKTGALIYVGGVVQGVGFRDYTESWSQKLGLVGYCRNLPDGRVQVEVEGDRSVIDLLIERLRKGPARSQVAAVDVTWKLFEARFLEFRIHD